MRYTESLSTLIMDFFSTWLINQRRVSPHTVNAYRDCFQLLLRYAHERLKKEPSQLRLTDIDAEFINDFLLDLENTREVCSSTRNARLAAIRSFFRYLAYRLPEKGTFISRVLAIQQSKTSKKQIDYLSDDELKAFLSVQNLETWVGRRDHLMILVAAELGLRLTELLSLKWDDISVSRGAGNIHCLGKGRKERDNPMTSEIARHFLRWKDEMTENQSQYVFPAHKGDHMTPACFQKRIQVYKSLAEFICESLKNKRITPHALRHTAAMNLLRKHVDLLNISRMLGHESINSTQIYLESDPSLKKEALDLLDPKNARRAKFKVDDMLVKYLHEL